MHHRPDYTLFVFIYLSTASSGLINHTKQLIKPQAAQPGTVWGYAAVFAQFKVPAGS